MILNKQKNEIFNKQICNTQNVIIFDYDMKENIIELIVQICI